MQWFFKVEKLMALNSTGGIIILIAMMYVRSYRYVRMQC